MQERRHAEMEQTKDGSLNTASGGEAIISVRHLSKKFGSHEVLKDIDFDVRKGDVTTVIGASGSGKSTLLRCINLLETPTSGQILYHGKDVTGRDVNVPKYRSHVGMVFQSFNLFPQYNVLENVTLAMKLQAKRRPDYKENKKEIFAEIDRKAKALIAKMGLSDKLGNYPCELSGGQQQRVSIVRAMALEPSILFFDEPTSALDPELTGEVLKVIRELAEENMTMVIVTHEMDFAREVSDNIIFMDNGVIAECGSADDLINNPRTDRLKAFLSKIGK